MSPCQSVFPLGLIMLVTASPVLANDFPTAARAEFVVGCMRESKAAAQEMLYKCSCTLDAIAQQVKYDDWVELSTVANAMPIAGERGGALRDLKDGRKRVAQFREMQDKAKKSCFIDQ